MSQIVLLTLVHQLSDGLTSDSKVKLSWLKEALGLLNPKEPSIAQNAARVLTELQVGAPPSPISLGCSSLSLPLVLTSLSHLPWLLLPLTSLGAHFPLPSLGCSSLSLPLVFTPLGQGRLDAASDALGDSPELSLLTFMVNKLCR